MPITSSVVEILGSIQRDGREVRVELCELGGEAFLRLCSLRWDGRGWVTHQKLSLRSDEAAGVVEALKRAIDGTPEAPGDDRRRRLDHVRRKLRRHERAHGRNWPAGTPRDD